MTDPIDFYDDPPPVETPERAFHIADYWAIVVKRRLLIGTCVVLAVGVSAVRSFLTPASYTASVVMNVEPERGSLLDVNAMSQYSGYDPDFLPTQMRLMRSAEIAERVAKKLNLAADRDFNPPKRGETAKPDPEASGMGGRVRGCLSTAPIRGTTLVELTCVAPTPKLAADIANTVAEVYIEWTVEAKFQIVNQASLFLAAQVEQLRTELQAKEADLLAYGKEKDIISVDPRQNVTLQKLETLNRDYASAVAERVAKEARYYEARTASPETVADTLSSGLVAQVQADVAKLEREYAEKLNLYKPEWPAMQQLKIQIDKSKQHLASVIGESVTKAREQARSEYLTALRREESLRDVLQSQKSEAMTLNTNAVEYNNLKIEVDTKRGLLDGLLKKQAETEMIYRLRGERVSNIRIVDRAVPPSGRSAPSHRRNLMLGLVGGGLLGLGLAFGLSFLDRSFHSAEQVEHFVKLPALGVIPAVGGADGGSGASRLRSMVRKTETGSDMKGESIELLPHREPRSTIAEAYRSFRAGLLLSRAGGVRSVVVTSCFPGEGKSSTAANLAVSLAQLGKRVLLVDADLHRPRLHDVFKVANKTGLVSILAEGLEPSQAILKTTVPGVYLVPSGPPSPNPSGLLSSEGMSKFLELAGMNFDAVVVDTPPLFPVSDVLVFAQQTDGIVLCVRAGRTSREQVVKARDRILRSRATALGVLLNGLDLASAGYGYGAAYRYAYYGREPEPAAGPKAVRSN
jgi:capsular exopolysaccharide synthesis family protein